MATALDASRRPWAVLLLAAAAVAVLAFQFTTIHRGSPLDVGIEEWIERSPDVPPARAWIAPILGSAEGGTLQPRVLLGRLAVALGGSRGLDVASSLLVVALALVLTLAARALGSRWLPAVAASLTLVVCGSLRAPSAEAPALAWQALLAALVIFLALAKPVRPCALVVTLALAVDGEPAWILLAVPVGAALIARRDAPLALRTGRVVTPAVTILLLLVALLHALVGTAVTFASMPTSPESVGWASSAVAAASSPAGAAQAAWLAAQTALLGPHWTGFSLTALATGASRFLRQLLAVWGLLGAVSAIAGVFALARQRCGARLSLVIGSLGAGVVLTAIEASPDARAATLLALLAVALLAAVGGTWLIEHAGHSRSRHAARVIVLLPPLLHVAAPLPPFRAFDGAPGAAYAEAVREALARDAAVSSGRIAIVSDITPLDRLLLPSAVSTGSKPAVSVTRIPRDPVVVARFVRAGYGVYAFPPGRRELAAHGVWFTERPLAHGSLGRYLDTLPPGAIAAIAVSGGSSAAVTFSPLPFADRIGGVRRSRSSATPSLCMLGRVGAPKGGVEAAGMHEVALNARAGEPIGRTRGASPVNISLAANLEKASVRVRHRGLVEADAGLAVAILDDAGDFVDASIVDVTTGSQLRIPRETLTLARADRVGECLDVAPGQRADLSALAANGRLGWSLSAPVVGTGPPAVLTLTWPEGRQQVLLQPGARWGEVRLGFLPTALGVAIDAGTSEVRLCGLPAVEHLLFESPGQQAAAIDMAADEASFGPGWYPHEREAGVPFRWASAEAQLFVRIERPAAIRLAVAASPAPDTPVGDVTAVVNSRAFEPRALSPGSNRYEWGLPSEAWRPGLNVVALRFSQTVQVPGDPRSRAAAVREIRFDAEQ